MLLQVPIARQLQRWIKIFAARDVMTVTGILRTLTAEMVLNGTRC
jgi:hypothetical protein